eukprot:800686-Rhodomonas_salina.1
MHRWNSAIISSKSGAEMPCPGPLRARHSSYALAYNGLHIAPTVGQYWAPRRLIAGRAWEAWEGRGVPVGGEGLQAGEEFSWFYDVRLRQQRTSQMMCGYVSNGHRKASLYRKLRSVLDIS